jgi:sucrose-6-phosphate hydrolase SacC (GH32 family)
LKKSAFFLFLMISVSAFGQKVDFRKLKSPILFKGDSVTAYRDPMTVWHNSTFYLYFTLTEIEHDGKIYMYTALSKSKDLVKWSPIKKLTPKDQNLDFSSPGNVIRYKGKWIMCLQTYPRPDYTVNQMPRYGTADSRLFMMSSEDLENWSVPTLLKVKGKEIAVENMGRMIDPYLVEDKSEKGKWWAFYKQNGASRSYSYDLEHWTYGGHIPAGENVCVLVENDEYVMFHSPKNGIGIKKSKDLTNWHDVETALVLGQKDWTWAKGRITAGYVLNLKNDTRIKRYLMFFHGSGPKTEEEGDFDKNASIGLAWSDDLLHWEWIK